ncbi:aminotransferase class V-fold PLP-dependent enzyme [Cognatiluteimonas profundi]|uniref:aminotransferase class V-fold PLP-dependent enzyme n=1 Tax=Cognatiluteimonas profundi TaxID=2594501 RepID=UPI00131DB574|nr:aminotransferase class V-fold PLP-dependent enzyme [Lysobacter profundi]
MHDATAVAPSDAAQADAFCLPDGIVYLDTATHGPCLRVVQQAAQRALDEGVAPWRLGDADWEASIERVRALAADCFDGDTDAVALVPSAAYGIAIAARNLPLARGEAVLVTAGAFPSQVLAWQQRCHVVGARLLEARQLPGESASDAVLRELDSDSTIRVLSLAHVDWRDGSVLDLDRIAAHARARGVALVLDLSQSLGALPARIARWKPAFAVSVGYKWLLGPGGMAYLWVDPSWRARGIPIEQHWLARDPVAVWRGDAQRPAAWRPGARRFDAGGVADPQRLAMAEAALQQVARWQIERIAPALRARTAALASALRAQGLSSWLAPDAQAHILGVRPPVARLDAIVAALAQAGVVTAVRQGCVRLAPHLHVGVESAGMVSDVFDGVARG